MILFAQDWARYPTAVIHTETRNRSWVRLAAIYREMGIKNHAFLLALVNPALRNVDPFDYENLTQETMMEIALECQINPWYFFREVARVPAQAGAAPGMVEANRGNIALWWSFFNHIMIILIQIRQTGKSFSTDTLMSYLMNIICQDTQINLLTKDDNLRRKNVERLKEIMAELPLYLLQRTKDDLNNGEEISIRSRNNSYVTHVPQASPKRAYNMGRGLTSPIFHIDEPPFQANISIALPAALAARTAVVDRAKAVGAPYGTILTTTAGKKDDKDGKYVFKLAMEAALWNEKAFFDCRDLEHLEETIRANSPGGKVRIYAVFNHRQLGKSDQWLKEKVEEALAEGDDASRDFFNMWTSGTESHPLPLDVLDEIVQSAREISHSAIATQGYITRWYVPEAEIEARMAYGKFVLGIDSSDASGGDDISFFVKDAETLETVCTGTYNETNLIRFATWLCDWLCKYKNVTAIIERKSSGVMILDYLLLTLPTRGEDPFKRLFNWVVNDANDPAGKDRFREINVPMGRRPSDIYDRYKKTFGWATSASGATSRTDLYSKTLQELARRGGSKVYDKRTIDQIAGLVIKNGRVDHEAGSHDDMVIAWLLCYWFLRHGKNLSFYGIDAVMSRVGPKIEEDPLVMQKRIFQQTLREKITQLYDRLQREADEFICMRLEHELRLLDRQVVLEEGEIYSVDELIRHAGEKRRDKRRHSQAGIQYGAQAGPARPVGEVVRHHHALHGSFSNAPPMYNNFDFGGRFTPGWPEGGMR